jgi:hypothetical protein
MSLNLLYTTDSKATSKNRSKSGVIGEGSGLHCLRHIEAELIVVGRVEFAKKETVILNCERCEKSEDYYMRRHHTFTTEVRQ